MRRDLFLSRLKPNRVNSLKQHLEVMIRAEDLPSRKPVPCRKKIRGRLTQKCETNEIW